MPAFKMSKMSVKMSAKMSKMSVKMSVSQFSPFEVGQVKAHLEHDLPASEIARRIFKQDGTNFGETAIRNCIEKLSETLGWRGERFKGTAGRPKKTTPKQDKAMVRWLLKNRGKEKVTVARLMERHSF